MASSPTEDTAPLLRTRLLADGTQHDGNSTRYSPLSTELARVLPVPLLCSVALHMTVAPTIWVYAYLFCEHPEQCRDEEKRQYASSVATATAVANAAGLLTLGYLARLVHWDARAGLMAWLLCRGLGVLGLAMSIYLRSFPCALGGQILQGLASDNLLHFNLNSIYARASSAEAVSVLMGLSLAFYMAGMAIGPAIAGFFPSFEWTFIVATTLFGAIIPYIWTVMSSGNPKNTHNVGKYQSPANPESAPEVPSSKYKYLAAVLAPAGLFYERPRSLLQGLSLFFYNMVQGYLFNLIFVFASVQFSFTSKENGLLLSLIAIVAASYLLVSLFIIPRLALYFGWSFTKSATIRPSAMGENSSNNPTMRQGRSWDLGAGAVSILIQTVAVATLSQVRQPSLVYLGASLTALGLAAPSFIKSYFVASLPDPTQGVAALALMETSGGLISPLVLGAWQAQHPGSSVFYLASGILGTSLFCLVIGAFL